MCRALFHTLFFNSRLTDLPPVPVLENLDSRYWMDLPGRAAPGADACISAVRIIIKQPSVDANPCRTALHGAAVAVPVACELAEVRRRPARNHFAEPWRDLGNDDLVPPDLRIALIRRKDLKMKIFPACRVTVGAFFSCGLHHRKISFHDYRSSLERLQVCGAFIRCRQRPDTARQRFQTQHLRRRQ